MILSSYNSFTIALVPRLSQSSIIFYTLWPSTHSILRNSSLINSHYILSSPPFIFLSPLSFRAENNLFFFTYAVLLKLNFDCQSRGLQLQPVHVGANFFLSLFCLSALLRCSRVTACCWFWVLKPILYIAVRRQELRSNGPWFYLEGEE